MTNSKVKLVSIIAVTAMILCAFIPIVNSNGFGDDQNAVNQSATNGSTDPPYKYVSLGDSMTTGFGISYDGMKGADYIGYYSVDSSNNITNQRGFLKEVDGTYPTLIAEYLSQYYNVDHAQLGISGVRSVDIRAFLYNDDQSKDYFPGDGRTDRHFIQYGIYDNIYNVAIKEYPGLAVLYGFDAGDVPYTFDEESRERAYALMCDIYQTELSDANLITYNSLCDFGHALEEIADLFRGDDIWHEFDYSLYFCKDYVKLAKEIEAKMTPFIAKVLAKYIIDEKASVIQKYIEMANGISKILAYSVISYCSDYDAIMKFIAENNDNGAKVIVIDPYNQFKTLSVEVLDHKIPFAEIYEYVLELVSSYTVASDAIYQYDNIEISHVTVDYISDDEARTFGDEFKFGTPSDESKAALMYAVNSETYKPTNTSVFSNAVAMYDLIDNVGNLTEFARIVFNTNCLDVESLLISDLNGLPDKVMNAMGLIADPDCILTTNDYGCLVSATAGSYFFTNAELFILFMELTAVNGDGILFHPNSTGYEAIFEAVCEEL